MARATPTTDTCDSRYSWQAMGTNALTEAAARVDVARLQQLGYVVQHNPNGTVTFWHPQRGSAVHEPTERQDHIQHLIAAGALHPVE